MAFNKKKSEKVEEKYLDVDASMQGTLSFKDPVNLRINGKFEGNLEIKGTLTIGHTAIVYADIIGDSIIISGRVKGKITAKKELELLSTAVVEGDIFPVRLSIDDGAIFEGKCFMLSEFMNVEEIARYLEVDQNLIIEWATTGKIPVMKENNNFRFERKAIDSWIASGKIG